MPVFVGLRDLRFAKGRFVLMGTVVALITLMVVLLSGLTAGLGRDSTSAVTDLPADHVVFSAPAEGQGISFASSTIGQDTLRRWRQVPGVRRAEPLGVTTTKATSDGRSTTLSAFGVARESRLAPDARRIAADEAVLSTGAADALHARAGDTVTVAGRRLTVTGVAGDASYSHTPVIWTSMDTWRHLSPGPGAATVIALSVSDTAGLSAADRRLGTETVSRADALQAIGSYSSENGSLQLMRGLLFAISAVVMGAFFTVWTIQRSGDVAVLKALGARTRYLLGDALGQALVLLAVGTAVGTMLAAAIGAAVSGSVPFVLDAGTILLPAVAMIALGSLGAALSIRRIASVDPLTALGSAR